MNIKGIKGEANGCVGRMWNIGKRKFGDDWTKRMGLFNVMVRGIIMYGVEIWGWKGQREIEKIKKKYMKLILKVDREIPGYILMLDTGEDRIEIKAGGGCKVGEKINKERRRFVRENMLGKENKRKCEGKARDKKVERRK